MDITNVDLFSAQFWLFVVIAVTLLTPLCRAPAREWVFALLNVAFLAQLLKRDIVVVLVGLATIYLWLRLLENRRGRLWLLALGAAVILGLFLLHKLPTSAHITTAERVLEAIGFSYVALRIVDAARAVCEGRLRAPSLRLTVNYLLPFHMLAAGPIQAYEDFMLRRDVPPALDLEKSLAAIERVTLGLSKKFVLANLIDKLFLTGFRASGPYWLLEMQMYYLWLFVDFSAYSDIAVGLGELLGMATPENFNHPYLARNIIEFWDRWHISLSQWIRRNLFFPSQITLVRLTDGRNMLVSASIAFLLSFVLCGLWHCVCWPWLIWGTLQACGLIACNIYRFALTRIYGRDGVKRYLARRWVRILAVVLTNEFFAATLVVVASPKAGVP